MAKFPTYEKMAKDVAEKALDEYIYKGKTLREWINILSSSEKPNKWVDAEVLDKIRAEIDSPNRGTCDYFIVDRIEEIIDKYKASPTGAERRVIRNENV